MGTKHMGRPAAAAAISALALLALAACGGGGTPGPAGPAGPPGPGVPVVVGPFDPLPGIKATITGFSGGTGPGGSFAVGNTITVLYTLTDGADADVNPSDYDQGSAYVSGPTSNYQRVIAKQDDVATASTWVGGGVWSYTFPVPIPATYLDPYNYTGAHLPLARPDDVLTGSPLLAGTYSVGLEFHKVYTVDAKEFMDAATDVKDFQIGGGAISPRQVVQNDNCNVCHTQLRVHESTRKDVRLCVLCHTAGAEDDNTAGATPGRSIEFKVMVHKIHNGEHLPSVLGVSTDASGNRLYPGMVGALPPEPLEFQGEPGELTDFSDVAFPVWPNLNVAMPKDLGYSALSSTDPDGAGPLLSAKACEDTIRTGVTACAKCHGDPDQGLDSNGPLLAPAQGDRHRTAPSRRACGACHDDIDWTKPYTSNGQTMLANELDASCTDCHKDVAANQGTLLLKPLSVTEAHTHPLNDPALDPGVRTTITDVSGGTLSGGKFQVGDSPTVQFTLTDDTQVNHLSLASMDACSAFFLGPTTNRQLVMPLTSPNGQTFSPFDFAGRLQSAGSGRGSMSKLFLGSPAVAGVVVVEFNTSSTHYTVNHRDSAGVVTALGTGDLPLATSASIPSGGSLSAFDIDPSLGSSSGTSTVVVAFSDATHFGVTGAVTGSGVLPNSINGSMRFTSSTLSFNVTVGSAPYSASSKFQISLFKGLPVNPVRFAIIAGGTAYSFAAPAPDRFYYEEVPDAVSPDFKYTLTLPQDIIFEDMGNGSGLPSQVLPAAGNLPLYYGRQQLWEGAFGSPTTTSTGAVAAFARQMDVAAVAGLKSGDLVVIDPLAGIGVREFIQIAPTRADGVVQASAPAGDPTGSAVKFYFKTPLRYAHPSGVTISKVTQTLRQEGAANAYTMNTATGVITGNATFSFSAVPLVMSYRTTAKFGYNLHGAGGPSLGRLQTAYVAPANDSTDIGQEQGDWHGLQYQDGTYTADMWIVKRIELGLQNESQSYQSTSFAAAKDFLYGTSTSVIVPHLILSDAANCYTCHNDVIFHGGGRRGVDACLTCHSISGNEDMPRWATPNVASAAPAVVNTALTTGVPIEFRQMLHKIHRGSGLFNAATYTVVGNGGNPSLYTEVKFPAMPGGVIQCNRCHGNNDSWKTPADRVHASASVPVRVWGDVCGSCHDSPTTAAHISSNTSGSGAEACSVCHGWGRVADVEKVHTPK